MKTAYEWRMAMDSINKPYGWVKNGEYVLYIDKPDSVFNYTPLYTHPVNPYQSITNTKIEPTVVSYTHPVKEQDTECQYCKQGCIRCDARKQLTDEEITACMGFLPKYNSEIVDEDLVNFARAILRKAGEK